jgi:hypothetical protein
MASVKATTTLAQKMGSIAGTWVKDPFRPNLQLQTLLQSLASHPKLTPQVVQAARTLRDNDMYKKVCFSREPSRFTIDLDAFYFLQYPLSKKTLQPASMPAHYDRLVEGFEKSAKGIGRPWWKIFFGIW